MTYRDTLKFREDDFFSDATSSYVPLGVALLKLSSLMEAIDHELYITNSISMEQARQLVRRASAAMDAKFDMEYTPLPQ
jgi:hypothetical protein